MDGGEGGGGGEEEGKISPMCESIGHRPLRGRCPRGNQKKVVNNKADDAREGVVDIESLPLERGNQKKMVNNKADDAREGVVDIKSLPLEIVAKALDGQRYPLPL